MSWNETQELRVKVIEQTLNNTQNVLNTVVTRRDLKTWAGLLQSLILSLENQIEQIEAAGIGPALDAHKIDASAHNTELDGRYFTQAAHINASAGIGDAAKAIVLDAAGLLDSSFLSTIDHGDLDGLTDDDHAQYLLIDGSRAMTGPLELENINTVARDILTPSAGDLIRNTDTGIEAYNGATWDKLDQDFEAFLNPLEPAGTTETIDFANGRNAVLDLASATGDVTLTLSTPSAGTTYTLKVIQGATARDLVWPAAVLWPGGTAPVISTGDDDIDIIQLMYDGTNYFGLFVQAFA